MVILCSCSPPQFWPRSPDKEKLMGGRSSENHDEMMTEVGSVTESNRDICFMQPRCHPDLKIAFQYLLQIFLPLEVTVVQVGVPPLLTHCAANFHVEHVFQTSDNLHHSFVYLPFFKQKQVVGTVVELVNPKASCLANARIVGIHWDREARIHG